MFQLSGFYSNNRGLTGLQKTVFKSFRDCVSTIRGLGQAANSYTHIALIHRVKPLKPLLSKACRALTNLPYP